MWLNYTIDIERMIAINFTENSKNQTLQAVVEKQN